MESTKREKDIDIEYNYIAMDSSLQVFTGFLKGYPTWDSNLELAKEVRGDTHLSTLQRWFPNKVIELIKVK